jgi:phage terminase small subunit
VPDKPRENPFKRQTPTERAIARANPAANKRIIAPVEQQRLTEFQERFVLEYLIDLNATAAYIRAGGDPKAAGTKSPALTKPNTLTGMAIARAKAERAKRVGFTADRVLETLGKIINGDRRAVFRPDGTVKNPGEFDEDDQVLIEGVKTRRIVEVGPDGKLQQAEVQEVKLASLTPAITLAMRHLGLLNDKLEVTHQTPLSQRLEEAWRRTGRGPLVRDEEAMEGVEYEDVTDGQEEGVMDEDEDEELRRMLEG